MTETTRERKGAFTRVLDVVERLGNKLPHPFMLFVYLALIIVVLSWFISLFGVTVEDPGTGEVVPIRSLISDDGIAYIFTSMIENFVTFAPLGLVLTIMLGIGLGQKVELFQTFMRKTVAAAPPALVTYVIIFAGVIGNLASDAAFIIIPPLAAMVFLALGRHPLAGMAAGFAAVGAGFTANVFIAGTDALLSGIATEALGVVVANPSPVAVVTPIDNWYFMSFSVLMLMVVGAFVTERIIEPRLGPYRGDAEGHQDLDEFTDEENKGLRNALIVAVVFLALLALLVLPAGSPLRNDEGGLVPSPLLDGIVPIILLFFVAISVAYGVTVGKITGTGDVPRFMGEAMKDMSAFIVLVFAAAQFIAYFEWTNLGTWVAVNGAELLRSVGLTGIFGLLGFTLLTTLLSFIIFSGSGLWALLAPIFIPLFFLLEINPAYVQVAYRIADSSTNILTPLNPYVPMLLAFMREYDEEAGFGTLFSLMLPYTALYLVCWIVIFVVWSLIGLPIGPGEPLYLNR